MISRILGIVTAKRNWKQTKTAKTDQRDNLGAEKCKKQALICGRYPQQKAKIKYAKLSSADKLWNDEYFKCCKIKNYCKDNIYLLETSDSNACDDVMTFRAWVETWEKKTSFSQL